MSRRRICVFSALLVVVALSRHPWAAPSRPGIVGANAASAAVTQVHDDVYFVNGRIRPLLLFWIGRDNIGEARVTRTRGSAGHETVELLIGSDPARAPRKINRWGYLREQVTPEGVTLLGLMRESDEKTLEEAEAAVAREGEGAGVFRAVRTTVRGRQAVSGTMRIQTPASFTFRQLDTILEMLPERIETYTTAELPAGTTPGFLFAMDAMLRDSVEPCARPEGNRRPGVHPVRYFYNRTLYDLLLRSCEFDPEFRTKAGVFRDVIDGRFEIINRRTGEVTRFQIAFGASGSNMARPVRAVFRPHWWIELELLLRDVASGRTYE